MTITRRFFAYFGVLVVMLGLTLTGCTPGSEPEAPQEGELQQFLADNPEFLEDDEEGPGEDDFDASADQ
ncbi:MAG: hypothetical protein AAGD07_11105 [Planctomycetota bacterium]